jgi:cysteinyl-tRNA synthetase
LINDGKESLTAEDIQLLENTISSFLFDVLGICNEASGNSNTTEKLSGVVEMLIGMRNEARANKNFALSDQIRDQLLALGIQLKDGKEGTSFTF